MEFTTDMRWGGMIHPPAPPLGTLRKVHVTVHDDECCADEHETHTRNEFGLMPFQCHCRCLKCDRCGEPINPLSRLDSDLGAEMYDPANPEAPAELVHPDCAPDGWEMA
jgi:hypothetical protein